MENEIELKIMLRETNVLGVKQWLNSLNALSHSIDVLGNTYFDTPEQFFAHEKMGLRVRSHNQRYELTLKMKGDIIGGLHIRPEYNLALTDHIPDFTRLVSHYHLPIENAEQISRQLQATFSTDFQREKWLIHFNDSEIEIALDQGFIQNPFGKEKICELEFELKQGKLADILTLLDAMPKEDGMWLSSLSKAQRGYLVGRADKIAKEIEKLAACRFEQFVETEKYQFSQQVADFLRISPNNELLANLFYQLEEPCSTDLNSYLTSKNYLERNLAKIKKLF